MAATLEENVQFLEEAKAALQNRKTAKKKMEDQEQLVKKQDKTLAAERKSVTDSIEAAVRKRKAELTDSYDIQIDDIRSEERTLKSNREKELQRGIQERIERETAAIVEANEGIKDEIRTLYKQNKVPRWCSSTFFCAIYRPRTLTEVLIGILTFFIAFAAVPFAVYSLVQMTAPWQYTLVTLADILVFGGLYLLGNNKIRIPHYPVLKEGQAKRAVIRDNNKKIKEIRNQIRKDKNQDMYGLQDMDQKIRDVAASREELEKKKQEVLDEFERNGKVAITAEITENNRKRLETIEQDAEGNRRLLEEYRTEFRRQAALITETYEPSIGKEFMEEDKLEAMAEMFRTGEALNISEAQEILTTGKKKAEGIVMNHTAAEAEGESKPKPEKTAGAEAEPEAEDPAEKKTEA